MVGYAHLHSQGILHGDVHPRNVVVDENKAVTLIDFGLATPIAVANSTPIDTRRGCIDLFTEPELARAHPPTRLRERLEELAALATPVARGLRWPSGCYSREASEVDLGAPAFIKPELLESRHLGLVG
ncbi:phosphotransferase [Mesorhizobium sp. M0145]|uniref:protein kinase domain-containing protein n=1 Tax=unclassified Mesorhizobium TaxID=325217 RepID=UPI003338DA02